MFALPPEASRDVTMGAMGALARLPLGPVTRDPIVTTLPVLRDPPRRALWYPDVPVNPGLECTTRRLRDAFHLPIPVGARLAHRPGTSPDEATDEVCAMIRALRPLVQFFTLDTRWGASRERWSDANWRQHVDAVRATIDDAGGHLPVFVALPPDIDLQTALRPVGAAQAAHGADGIVFGGGIAGDNGYRVYGAPTRDGCLNLVRQVREKFGDYLLLVVGDVVDEPSDAREALARGANLVQLHSGFVYSGPGLPKRINEALVDCPVAPAALTQRALAASGWFWMLLLIANDRAGLGGALVSDGLAVLLTALWGYRRGARWLWWGWLLAGIAGFVTAIGVHFAIGYTDPWHLAPAVAGGALYLVWIGLTYPYLWARSGVRRPERRLGILASEA